MDNAVLRELIDEVALKAGQGGQLEQARSEFDHRRGRAFDDDPTYAEHMAFFLEWFVAERRSGAEAPPLEGALDDHLSQDKRPLGRALLNSHRSLFLLIETQSTKLLLQDLIHGALWLVRSPFEQGFEPNMIFEARLFPWEQDVELGPTVLFHPSGSTEPIKALLRAAKQQGKLDRSCVDNLAQLRLRYGRFRHPQVGRIYAAMPGEQPTHI